MVGALALALEVRPVTTRSLFGLCKLGFKPTPPASTKQISPIFISDKGNLAVSREKDGKLRLIYAGWDDAKVVEASEGLELRAS